MIIKNSSGDQKTLSDTFCPSVRNMGDCCTYEPSASTVNNHSHAPCKFSRKTCVYQKYTDVCVEPTCV